MGMCFGRVVLWPRGDVGGSSKTSRGGVEQGVGVKKKGRRSASASESEFFVGLDSRVRLLAEQGLTFFASLGPLGEIDLAAASGFFRAMCSLGFMKFDQKGCVSEGGLCTGIPRGEAIFGQQASLSVTS
jgi:hypothetical protein